MSAWLVAGAVVLLAAVVGLVVMWLAGRSCSRQLVPPVSPDDDPLAPTVALSEPPPGIDPMVAEFLAVMREVIAAVAPLPAAVNNMTATVERDRRSRRIMFALLAVVISGGMAMLGLVLATQLLLKDATTPGGKVYDRTQANTQKLISEGLIDEDECRRRRLDAELDPPPNPALPCRDQTPAEVYVSPLCSLPDPHNPCRPPKTGARAGS